MSHGDNDQLNFLLLADMAHFGESLWRNEEVGEKRFNFFLTLVTAVIAGLVAFHTTDPSPDAAVLSAVTNGALIALLVLGFMTYLRMLQRNRVTDEYKETLRYLRRAYRMRNAGLEEYEVPVPIDWGVWEKLRGGLAEMVGAVCSVVLVALLVVNDVGLVIAVVGGVLTMSVSWVVATSRRGVSA